MIPKFLNLTDKRNSTGNLYFDGGGGGSVGNANDRPLSSLSNTLQQGSARIFRGLSGSQPVGMRDSNSSLSSMNSEYDPNDPQAMFSRELRTAAGEYFLRFESYKKVICSFLLHSSRNFKGVLSFLGDLGKELKNLITLMDQEEMQEREKAEQQKQNKESPV